MNIEEQNGYKCQSPKQAKEWQKGWWCCFTMQKEEDAQHHEGSTPQKKNMARRSRNDESFEGTQKYQKKTLKMQKINSKKKLNKNPFITLHRRRV